MPANSFMKARASALRAGKRSFTYKCKTGQTKMYVRHTTKTGLVTYKARTTTCPKKKVVRRRR